MGVCVCVHVSNSVLDCPFKPPPKKKKKKKKELAFLSQGVKNPEFGPNRAKTVDLQVLARPAPNIRQFSRWCSGNEKWNDPGKNHPLWFPSRKSQKICIASPTVSFKKKHPQVKIHKRRIPSCPAHCASVAFCSPARSLTFCGLMEDPLVGQKLES